MHYGIHYGKQKEQKETLIADFTVSERIMAELYGIYNFLQLLYKITLQMYVAESHLTVLWVEVKLNKSMLF